MTAHIAQAYDTLVLNRPKIILALLLTTLIFFGYHTKDFKLDASADTLLLEEDVDLNIFRKINERYPSNELLIVTYTPNEDLFSDQALMPMIQLREELRRVSRVNTVFSILDAPLFDSSDADIQEMLKNMPSLEKPDVDRARAREELIKSPIYRDLIVSGDGKTTALLLEMTPNVQFEKNTITHGTHICSWFTRDFLQEVLQ